MTTQRENSGMGRPRIWWGWPEIFAIVPSLRGELEEWGDVVCMESGGQDGPRPVDRFDIVVPSLSQEVDAGWMRAIPGLRIIGTPTTGTDHIDVAFAEQAGIRVISIKNERALLDDIQSTAELAWLLILACQRNLRAALTQGAAGGWDASAIRGHELIGKTMGIVGHGRLGSMMSRFALAFRMCVLAADPQPVTAPGVRQVSFDTLLAEADIVTVHVHLSDATHGMFDAATFGKMKTGAVFVNTSRGALVDEEALLAALESGKLAAAGLDVICNEREADRANGPLLRYAATHSNLIVTPHLGGTTVEAKAKAQSHLVQLLKQAWLVLEATK
jgi:phosphoglycerate dehydrogenase-like enzyme